MLELLNNFAVILGAMLLYFAPLLTWTGQGFLKKYAALIDMRFTVLIGASLTAMLGYLVPQAWWIFLFYFMLFHFTRFYSRYGSLFQISKLDSFSISVYLCFAVGVLWEWPINLVTTQSIDTLIIASFKILAVPLFFYKAYKLGFKFRSSWIMLIIIAILGGIFLIPFANNMNINFYRLAWAFTLLAAIPIKIKHLSSPHNY